jgi:hypothetical protein
MISVYPTDYDFENALVTVYEKPFSTHSTTENNYASVLK